MIRKIKFFLISVFIISNINALPSKAKKQVEPQNVKIELPGLELLDYPSDRGDSLILKWDTNNDKELIYEIMVSTDEKNWKKVKEQKEGSFTSQNIDLPFWIWNKKENKNASVIEIMKVFNIQEEEFFKEYSNGFKLYAKLNVISQKQKSESQTVSAIAIGNWFRADRLNSLIIVLLVSLVFFMVVSHAKKRELFIRRIAGLDAIDEAVGRATEMGKPVIYVPGIGSMSNISTIASVFILGEVGKKIAQYDANIKVPHYDPIVSVSYTHLRAHET
ncbi:MAG: hypothetical protein N2Z60_04380, partial [Elusimicrobiales bacterium]|nr:hypothetical protein [Elusimicrobiales bacterium]